MTHFNEEDEKMVWPGHVSDFISVPVDLPLPKAAVKRVADEIMLRGRGEVDVDPVTGQWVMHLALNDADRGAASPFLIGVTDMWVAIGHIKPEVANAAD